MESRPRKSMQPRGREIGRRPFLRGGAAALGVGVLPQPFVGDWLRLRREPKPDAEPAMHNERPPPYPR